MQPARLIPTIFAMIALAASASIALHAAPANYVVTDKIPLSGTVRWDYLSASPSTGQLFITRGSLVSVIDTKTDKEIGQIPNTAGCHGTAVLARLGLGFISDGGSNSVTVFDLKSLAVKATIPVGDGPDGIVADPSTNKVISMDGSGQDLSIIDGNTLKVVGTVKLNGRPEGYAVDGKGHVFTHYEDKSEVAEVDEATATIVKEWPLAPGDGPSGMVVDRRENLLFSACHNQILTVSNIATGKVIATAAIDNGPDAAAYDASSGTIFVPCGQDGLIDVIQKGDDGKYVVVDRAKTQAGARTIAFDNRTKTLYTCTGSPAPADASAPAAPPAQGGYRRPRYADNSMVVLVLKSE